MRAPAKRLIVFDLGRVLVQLCEGWHDAFARAGIPLPENAIDEPTRAHLLHHVHQIETGHADVADFCQEIATRLNIPCEDVTRMWQCQIIAPYKGADALLRDLSAAGVATACLSNTNAEHWRALTDSKTPLGKLLATFDHRFASHLIRARKPQQAVYSHVEMKTGYSPSKILFFDDVEENLVAARTQGWSAHLVERSENPVPELRKFLIDRRILPPEPAPPPSAAPPATGLG